VDAYRTEDEQVEALKKWWKANGKSVVVGVAVGLLAFGGARYWVDQRTARAEQASLLYEQMMGAVEAENPEVSSQVASTLLSQFNDTPYAAFAAMAMAKLKFEEDDSQSAITYYHWVLENDADEGLQQIARLRLARVLFEDNRLDEALAELREYLPPFKALYEELRGDIFTAQGNMPEARAAYQAALDAGGTGDDALLQMKLQNTGAASAES